MATLYWKNAADVICLIQFLALPHEGPFNLLNLEILQLQTRSSNLLNNCIIYPFCRSKKRNLFYHKKSNFLARLHGLMPNHAQIAKRRLIHFFQVFAVLPTSIQQIIVFDFRSLGWDTVMSASSLWANLFTSLMRGFGYYMSQIPKTGS